MPNPKRRRRILRRTRDKLKGLKFAGFKGLAQQRDQLLTAVKARIAAITRNLRQPDFRVIPRSEWGARPPRSVSHMANDSGGVFVHHSVGAAPTSEDGERTEMRAIQRFHMDTRAYVDIGYSFVVAPSGRIYEGRGLNVAGAHTQNDAGTGNYNSTSYGLCVMGNYENQVPNDAVIASLRWLRRSYLNLGDRPVRSHSQVYATACCGRHLRARLGEL